MTSRALLLWSAPCLALALGACDKTPDHSAAKAAGGKVLPGTISDAMLNLDQSRARPLLQPPVRERGPAADATGDNADDTAAPDAPAPADAVAKPAPTN